MKPFLGLLICLLFLSSCTLFNEPNTINGEVNSDEMQEWIVDEPFQVDINTDNGQIKRNVIGKANHVIVTYDENIGFIAGKPHKYIWYFWGDEKELNGQVAVVATEKDSGVKVRLFEQKINNSNKSPIGDQVISSGFTFSSAGIWKMEIFINDIHFDEIFVEVKA